MKTTVLISLQMISLLMLIGSANNLFESVLATTVFTTSFFTFAACSIYISEHQKRIMRELEREFGA